MQRRAMDVLRGYTSMGQVQQRVIDVLLEHTGIEQRQPQVQHVLCAVQEHTLLVGSASAAVVHQDPTLQGREHPHQRHVCQIVKQGTYQIS